MRFVFVESKLITQNWTLVTLLDTKEKRHVRVGIDNNVLENKETPEDHALNVLNTCPEIVKLGCRTYGSNDIGICVRPFTSRINKKLTHGEMR